MMDESAVYLAPRLVDQQPGSSSSNSSTAETGAAAAAAPSHEASHGLSSSSISGNNAADITNAADQQQQQQLPPLLQALLLGWASHIKKGTSQDELQQWQMAPFVEAVLQQQHTQYMLHATARLLKCRWAGRGRGRGRGREGAREGGREEGLRSSHTASSAPLSCSFLNLSQYVQLVLQCTPPQLHQHPTRATPLLETPLLLCLLQLFTSADVFFPTPHTTPKPVAWNAAIYCLNPHIHTHTTPPTNSLNPSRPRRAHTHLHQPLYMQA